VAFWTYSQNNSGGSFDRDRERGIGEYVIVEAESADAANDKAERIGLYFDGDGDCSCCGDRWSSQWDYRGGSKVPSVYGDAVSSGNVEGYRTPAGFPTGFVHYADGRIEGF
jgi:hypothetical protein